MRHCIFSLLFIAMMAMTGQAHAFCSNPSFMDSAPSAPGSYERPDMPVCLKDRDRTCTDYEMNSYEREIQSYIGKLNDYASKAVDFANEARDYAEKAKSYAECEVGDMESDLR